MYYYSTTLLCMYSMHYFLYSGNCQLSTTSATTTTTEGAVTFIHSTNKCSFFNMSHIIIPHVAFRFSLFSLFSLPLSSCSSCFFLSLDPERAARTPPTRRRWPPRHALALEPSSAQLGMHLLLQSIEYKATRKCSSAEVKRVSTQNILKKERRKEKRKRRRRRKEEVISVQCLY